MSRPARAISKLEKQQVRNWLDHAKRISTFRRVLCIWMRINGYKTEKIAEIVGWSVGQVQKVQSEFLRQGDKAFMNPGRGGRRSSYLSEKDEKAFLNSIRDRQTGMIYLGIAKIKNQFEEKAKLSKNAVSDSTICRLLKRHGYKSVRLKDGGNAFQK